MLIRRSPGGGICYMESVPSTKSKAKAADNFRRNQGCVQKLACYNLSIMDGGTLQAIPVYFLDFGSHTSIPVCFINAGSIAPGCYNFSILNGGNITDTPIYSVNSGDLSVSPVCFIDFGVI